ncbi:MAG: MBL fold metallo-hydrolase [Alphaproteobacteria bacterium]|nr:MBL fold metallo-hydrolase [Alphaproteobacteria bacterium]
MKITVLGCGSSGGVPLIGGNWGLCDPNEPRNRRTRPSLLIEHKNATLLVDTSPDMREQTLKCGLKNLDAVLFTHAHADHSHGIDELRSVNWLTQKPVDLYADAMTLADLNKRFSYVFHSSASGNFYKPSVTPHEITGAFSVHGIDVLPIAQNHGASRSLGFRFGDFAYSTDVHDFDEASFAKLQGVKTWIVDCMRVEPHPAHAHLAQALEWIEKIKPDRAFLTHMSHRLDYKTLTASLPTGVWPAYDGLVIEC